MQQFGARRVAYLEGAGMFVGIDFFRFDIPGLPAAGMGDLKAFLVCAFLADEIGQYFEGNVDGEEFFQFFAEEGVGGRVDGGVGIERMDMARVVRDHGDAFMFDGSASLFRKFGTVEPHGFGHDTPVVGDDAVVDVDEVLRMQRRSH